MIEEYSYYPDLHTQRKFEKENQRLIGESSKEISEVSQFIQFGCGKMARTDGLDVDGTLSMLETKRKTTNDPELKDQIYHLVSRMKSVSDLTPTLYDEFGNNPNTMINWLPQINKGLQKSNSSLKTPHTKMLRLPIELAQFIRLEYLNTTPASRELFNKLIFEALELEDDETYFIKTGTFSSKFEFRNAKCSEPREMGEYFQVINNFAMTVGAGHSVDIVAREYIEDVENNPTIYNGMPLRTEFRVFVDFDKNIVEGTANYWHPIVMRRALSQGLAQNIQRDYETYSDHQDKIMREFDDHKRTLEQEVERILPSIDLSGRYSVDIMKNRDDFYIIDLAKTEQSALYDYIQ